MMAWGAVFILGLIAILATFGMRLEAIRSFSRPFKLAMVAVVFLKVFIALSMGHLDIVRFIYFIKYFVAFPSLNPWEFSSPLSDFPYPPALLYLNSILFFAKRFILQSWPLVPDVWDFILIRIPFLVVDIFFSRFLLKRSVEGFVLFLFSPVMLFHQVYSGQLDLIAAVPFIFSLVAFADGKQNQGFFWMVLSMVLKPYAVLFLPFLLFFSKTIKDFFKIGTLLGLSFLFFKLSEFPFVFSPDYARKMGAGAKFLLIPKYLGFYFLVWVGIAISLWRRPLVVKRSAAVYLGLFLISFGVAVVDYHSAGWLLWPVLIFTVWSERAEWLRWRWTWWVWGILFVLRWSFIDHSPFFDSLDVFLNNYLQVETRLGMGYFYRNLEGIYSKEAAEQALRFSVHIFEIFTYFMFGQIGYTFFIKMRKVT